uniref:EF-hand domain-containing protein n=1 Tax=Panagrolaimus davidi TaxID=227884 RepID=A0A914P9B7_9BILA
MNNKLYTVNIQTKLLFLRRWKSQMFKPGMGLRTIEDLEAEKKRKAAEEADENPMNFTIFGNHRQPKPDPFFYSDRKGGRGYSDYSTQIYSNRPYVWQPIRKLYKFNYILMGILGAIFLGFSQELWDEIDDLSAQFFPKAAEIEKGANDELKEDGNGKVPESEVSEGQHSDAECSIIPEEVAKKKKPKIGFRERRIIEYENRLRAFSSPDKIFRYFATLKSAGHDGNYEVFMTPEDFVRSLTPGVMQPRNLGLDKFKVFNPQKHKCSFTDPDNIFTKLGTHGLISFTDYLFLMTVLSTSQSEFKLAFGIFDVNSDSSLDKDEFLKVQRLLLSQTNVGQRHRDHVMGNSAFKWSPDSAIINYFFGKEGEHKLNIDTFLEFQHDLHRDILKIEFERRDPESNPVGIISEVSFAELLLMHAGLPEKRQKRMMKRIRRRYRASGKHPGISFDEVNAFFQVLYYIDTIDTALHFYKLAGKPLTKEMLMKTARRVAGVRLTEHLVDVVVTLFDEDLDGELSHKEFVAVMKKRMQRGLEKPKDTGFFRILDAGWECGKRQVLDYLELRS